MSSSVSTNDSTTSTWSCLNRDRGKCMMVRQFLDFNPTGPVYAMQIIPVQPCVQIAGDVCTSSCRKLNLKFQEMRAPYFVEIVRAGVCDAECNQSCPSSSSTCTSSSCKQTSTPTTTTTARSLHKKQKATKK